MPLLLSMKKEFMNQKNRKPVGVTKAEFEELKRMFESYESFCKNEKKNMIITFILVISAASFSYFQFNTWPATIIHFILNIIFMLTLHLSVKQRRKREKEVREYRIFLIIKGQNIE